MQYTDLSHMMMRRRVSRLRSLAPRPFGLQQQTDDPVPVMLGSETWEVTPLNAIRALLTRSPIPLEIMSLLYGDFFDLSAQLVEVTTRWDGGCWMSGAPLSDRPPSAWELGRAERRDAAIARQDWQATDEFEETEPAGPFEFGPIEISINGLPRTVEEVSYRHYRAFSFAVGSVNVTVVSRHPLGQMPSFEEVTDLEPYFAGSAHHVSEMTERING